MAGSELRRGLAILVVAVAYQPHSGSLDGRVSIDDPRTYWTRTGFVEMTPPIRLPSRDGRERITVWLRVPEGENIALVWRDGRPRLTYPPGTVADRVDLRDGQDPGSVEDVRGTQFTSGGEYFHVLRPLGLGDLAGVEWARGDRAAARAATDRMLAHIARFSRHTFQFEVEQQVFERHNDCAICHEPGKEERVSSRQIGADGLPNRGTDAAGLYTVASVLADSAPLERHRAHDMNEGDPYISVLCSDQRPAVFRISREGQVRHYACEDQSIPRARFDLVRALSDGDTHAIAVCASRAYLWRHMAEDGHRAFASVFGECFLR
jgi:hypothetical protein